MHEAIILDGGSMTSVKGTHRYLKEMLRLPEHYTGNLDALRHVLSTIAEPVHIRLVDMEKARQCLGGYMDAIVEVFTEASQNNSRLHFEVT